jgi:hypothetical protein
MKFRLIDLVIFLVLITAVVGGLFYARHQAFATYGDQAAQVEWDAWREDAQKLAKGTGPVARRTPKSAAPPALVLMRDHFVICLTASVLLSSVLFFTMLAFVRGAMSADPFVDRSPPEPKETQDDAE